MSNALKTKWAYTEESEREEGELLVYHLFTYISFMTEAKW